MNTTRNTGVVPRAKVTLKGRATTLSKLISNKHASVGAISMLRSEQ
jgi:hypothetical protein